MKYIFIAALIYILIINIIAFIAYGIDKRKAQNSRRRISEKTLISFAVCGGAIGAVIGMFSFHHKTRKIKFVVIVPAFTVIWTVVTGLLVYKLITG